MIFSDLQERPSALARSRHRRSRWRGSRAGGSDLQRSFRPRLRGQLCWLVDDVRVAAEAAVVRQHDVDVPGLAADLLRVPGIVVLAQQVRHLLAGLLQVRLQAMPFTVFMSGYLRPRCSAKRCLCPMSNIAMVFYLCDLIRAKIDTANAVLQIALVESN